MTPRLKAAVAALAVVLAIILVVLTAASPKAPQPAPPGGAVAVKTTSPAAPGATATTWSATQPSPSPSTTDLRPSVSPDTAALVASMAKKYMLGTRAFNWRLPYPGRPETGVDAFVAGDVAAQRAELKANRTSGDQRAYDDYVAQQLRQEVIFEGNPAVFGIPGSGHLHVRIYWHLAQTTKQFPQRRAGAKQMTVLTVAPVGGQYKIVSEVMPQFI